MSTNVAASSSSPSTVAPLLTPINSSFRAEATNPTSRAVHFPPADFSDMVIHYRGASFHVHRIALCSHSGYFTELIKPLVAGRCAVSTEHGGGHPTTPHCLDLSDGCGKVNVSVDGFWLFLCHLYFPAHYSCLPYTVATHIDVNALPQYPERLPYPYFPTWVDLESAMGSKLVDAAATDPPAIYDTVMELARHFQCTGLLSRVEENCLLVLVGYVDGGDGRNGPRPTMREVWQCHQLAERFDLQWLKEFLLPVLSDRLKRRYGSDTEWEARRQQLVNEIQARLDGAAS